jgi:hypothetical protein
MSSAADLAHQHISNIGRCTADQNASIYAEAVRTMFPFAPQGHTTSLETREERQSFLARISEFTIGRAIRDLEVQETASAFVIR